MTEFRHLHTAHCESGVTAALLGNAGLRISEPLAFGIGSGLLFFFPPLLKVVGMPVISFRTVPGSIFKKACRRLGVELDQRRFSSEAKGIAELDRLLAQGIPVGLQTNMFWLSYFPKEFRSQFNGHNLIALKREGERYLLSDPMLEEPTWLDADALRRSRFSKGLLAPKGSLYRPKRMPREIDLSKAVSEGVRDAAKTMLARMPMVGVRGIRRLARRVRSWEHSVPDEHQRVLLLGHIVRMQEEVGSGGAGFRYLYAAFLQEAGQRLDHQPFLDASERMTAVGDLWRYRFAVTCGRIMKGRDVGGESLATAAEILLECADEEEAIYRFLLGNLPERATYRVPIESLGAAS